MSTTRLTEERVLHTNSSTRQDIMTIFLIALGALSLWAIVAALVGVARDGHRRIPTRNDAPTVVRAPKPEQHRRAHARSTVIHAG
ncbi:hypothetical protein [Herbiconiux daphne]|nr:hypothetical protein [Herbiconiux daphne]